MQVECNETENFKRKCEDGCISISEVRPCTGSATVRNSTATSPEDHSKPLSSRQLPLSPTFSPRKNTQSSFSPLELEKCLATSEEDAQTPGFSTSIPLFSTPSPNITVSPHTERKKDAKRTLFPATDNPTIVANTSSDCFSDISLSEFLLNLSSVGSSPDINRYLVLEVTTQTSEVQENGRLDIQSFINAFTAIIGINRSYY